MFFKARIGGVSWLIGGGFKDCGISPMFTSKGQRCGYGLITAAWTKLWKALRILRQLRLLPHVDGKLAAREEAGYC